MAPEPQFKMVADLLHHFGRPLALRVRLNPPAGTATPDDVIATHHRHGKLCELIDGALIQKATGLRESFLAVILYHFLARFLEQVDVGAVLGDCGVFLFGNNQVRVPDVSFVRWAQIPDRRIPADRVLAMHPDLAVEILSPQNSPSEMDRKLADYFAAGTSLVWYMDPIDRLVRVHTSPDRSTVIDEYGMLDGGDVLPGFRLAVRDWLARAEWPVLSTLARA